jgi:hypothetical protein
MVPDGATSFVEDDCSGREGSTASIWKPCNVVGIFVARLPRLGSDGVSCGEVDSEITGVGFAFNAVFVSVPSWSIWLGVEFGMSFMKED